MGARRWRMGSGFPGYNGPAPRATRTSRGSRRVSFDWLATVAELLQGGGGEGETVGSVGAGTQTSAQEKVLDSAEAEIEEPCLVKELADQVAADHPGEIVNVKSDNESGTSESEAKRLNLQCQMNQASHDEGELKDAGAAGEAAEEKLSEMIKHVHEALVDDGISGDNKIDEKPGSTVLGCMKRCAYAKVKDEQSTSECIASESGNEKPQRSRRPRKRRIPQVPIGANKRNHVECDAGTGGNFGKPDYYQRTKRRKHFGDEDMISSPYSDEYGDSEPPAAAPKLRRAKAASAKGAAKKAPDGHVRVSVKSLIIPELYVDIPESATIGSLKRAVMDAAMNLLGGGLRVCVLLQGRKIPDEAVTLSQMGISHSGKNDSLGFMLEPTSSLSGHDDPLLVLLHAANQPNQRYVVPVEGGGWAAGTAGPNAANAAAGPAQWEPKCTEQAAITNGQQQDNDEQTKNDSDSTSTLSQATPCKQQRIFDSKAIILHPGAVAAAGGDSSTVAGAMALVPLRPKVHSLDIHKRRIRRPFTVGEVEALVTAVEHLGTGRWRDVKLQAFENAKHRTYVDLKDKWKTLVHTAQIAPHQRRGDPVPQELLDRVIAANTFWAAHQAKEQAELEA